MRRAIFLAALFLAVSLQANPLFFGINSGFPMVAGDYSVTFNPPDGNEYGVSVTLSSALGGATIFYTVGATAPANPTHTGTTPTGSTVVYSGPVATDSTHKIIKALAWTSGNGDTAITTALYVIPGDPCPHCD